MKTPRVSVKELITPIGQMLGAASEEGLLFLGFADSLLVGFALKQAVENCGGVFEGLKKSQKNPHLLLLQRELTEYFAEGRKTFSVPVILTGTTFQKKAWRALESIPYGETWSYSRQAASMGVPQAVRAVGSANGKNRIPIVVPCHRVIAKDGSLGGYTGGLWRKEYLLALEREVLQVPHST